MSEAYLDDAGNLHLPERVIPLPAMISDEARAALRNPGFVSPPWPDTDDTAVWKAFIAEREALMMRRFARMPAFPGRVETHALAHAALYELVPEQIPERNRDRALLFVHGGAYIMGGGIAAVRMTEFLARAAQCRVYSVDYRMPPDYPYPHGLDDTVEAWRFVLSRHAAEKSAMAGVSAGGGLAASAVLRIRDLGLPLPAAALLLTPECDLTESGDSFETNREIDVVLKRRLTAANLLYAGGHDLRDPYLSAIFGDFGKGYCPTFLMTGTRDLFLSNTVLMHRALRRACIAAELHVFEAMPHGGFFGTPEDREAMAEQVAFLDRTLAV
ncbi:MAG: alpha/beta hydrolase [Gammaproteobacteria bacterium]